LIEIFQSISDYSLNPSPVASDTDRIDLLAQNFADVSIASADCAGFNASWLFNQTSDPRFRCVPDFVFSERAFHFNSPSPNC
jgi:hypothetical protein